MSRRRKRVRDELELIQQVNDLAEKLPVYWDPLVPRLYRGGCTQAFKDQFDKAPLARPFSPKAKTDSGAALKGKGKAEPIANDKGKARYIPSAAPAEQPWASRSPSPPASASSSRSGSPSACRSVCAPAGAASATANGGGPPCGRDARLAHPFWSCFAAHHLQTCIEGFLTCTAIESNYSMALGSLNATGYFRVWARREQEALEGMLRKQAERTAAVDVRSDPQKFQLGCSMLGILLVELATSPASVLPGPIHSKIVSSLRYCRSPPRPLPGNPLANHMLDGLISVLEGSGVGFGGREGWKCGLPECTRRENDGKGEELRRCSRCRSEFYCSAAHQREDWAVHRAYCFENDLL